MSAAAHHHLFYAPPGSIVRDRIRFPRDESAHMVVSLRLAEGDAITATDGAGRLFEAEIEKADRECAVARVERVVEVKAPQVEITLFQGMIRPQRMDLVVEKCVELGVNSIVPVVTERALGRDAEQRRPRWEKIALEAMKQSLRVYLPEIRAALPFREMLGELERLDRVMVAHNREATRAQDAGDLGIARGKVGLLIGPEGGFSEAEISALSERGAVLFGLGEARLKSETAAIAAVAIIRQSLR